MKVVRHWQPLVSVLSSPLLYPHYDGVNRTLCPTYQHVMHGASRQARNNVQSQSHTLHGCLSEGSDPDSVQSQRQLCKVFPESSCALISPPPSPISPMSTRREGHILSGSVATATCNYRRHQQLAPNNFIWA